MWTSADSHRATINRVRLHGTAGLEPLSAQLRAERAIGHAVGSVSLAAGAILCIRRLVDPRPGRVSLDTLQSPPGEWTRAVTERIADLARRAGRPARGSVGADAEAVIFDDRAELLACLAADWCRGSIFACWWWRALIGASGDTDAVLRAWLAHPAHIAAAIRQAVRLGAAPAFIARLSERHTSMLLGAVVSAHGLDQRLASSAHNDSSAGVTDACRSLSPSGTAGVQPETQAPIPPWSQPAPEASIPTLRRDQQELLGIALVVSRDPARARAATFVEQVLHWRHAVAVTASTVMVADRGATSAPGRLGKSSETTAITSEQATGSANLDLGLTRRDSGARTISVSPSPTSSADASVARDPILLSPIEEDGPVCRRSFAALASVETELGGIFYLLNAALALGLYGDFTMPKGPRLDLSIWHYIALVGNALLGGRHRRDPVWSLLADLAGPISHSFQATSAWRLDSAWLEAFPEPRTWRWSADQERVRIRHPEGFVIVDVPRSLDETSAQQARDEVAPYRAVSSFRLARGRTARRTEPTLARWTRWHAAYMRARLARALGVRGSRVGRLLCRHHARVHLSLTHVDVAFSLCNLPIAIRLSGLDRDPGWIPAADRVVSFRYD
jgi:hypothetical protein